MKNFKPAIPHIVAVVIFAILACVYFAPSFSGYIINPHDMKSAQGMQKEATTFLERENEQTLWTNAAFSGMPTYQIWMKNSNNIPHAFTLAVFINNFGYPISLLLIAMLSFYILLLCFDVKPWLSIVGAIAFAFTSINILYIGNGHVTKILAISFLPGVLGSMILAFRKNMKIGALLLCIFVSFHISANHLQQTYYFMFLAFAVLVYEFYHHYKEKILAKFAKISALLIIAVVLGILPTMSNLLLTYKYSKYTTRGKSELTINADQNIDKSEGLDHDYIKQYSLGYGEIWSVAVPNIKGGAGGYLGSDPDRLKNVSPDFKQYVASFNSYWGEQAASGGAFYFGAVTFLLFVLGLIFLRDRIKWVFLGVSILAIVLAWKYSSILEMFINSFPMFNKFRDTKMIMILMQITFPLTAILFLKEIMTIEIDKKKLNYALLGIIGVFILFYITPTTFFDFFNREEVSFFDKQMATYSSNSGALQQYEQFKTEIQNVRIDIFKADVLRSIVFMGLAGLLIFFYVRKKLSSTYLIVLTGVLILVDLWSVDKRYFNNEKQNGEYKAWVKNMEKEKPFPISPADMFILNNEEQNNPALTAKIKEDVAKHANTNNSDAEYLNFESLNAFTDYRVFTFQDPFNSSNVCYFHKSIGGYHGAKLKRYQDIIDFRIQNEQQALVDAFKTKSDTAIFNALKYKTPTFNMLNTKYFIYNPDAAPIVNPNAMGNCWFVKNVKVVENQDEEILSLNTIDPKSIVVVEKSFANLVKETVNDTTATIALTSYKPNHLIYESNAASDQIAVFSEVYYPDGWNALIDGKEVPYFRSDYILRGLAVPAGKHTIEFKFEPEIYYTSRNISYAGVFLVILFAGGMLFWDFKSKKAA